MEQQDVDMAVEQQQPPQLSLPLQQEEDLEQQDVDVDVDADVEHQLPPSPLQMGEHFSMPNLWLQELNLPDSRLRQSY